MGLWFGFGSMFLLLFLLVLGEAGGAKLGLLVNLGYFHDTITPLADAAAGGAAAFVGDVVPFQTGSAAAVFADVARTKALVTDIPAAPLAVIRGVVI